MFVFLFLLLQMVSICQSGKAKKLLETSEHIFSEWFIQELERQTVLVIRKRREGALRQRTSPS